MNVLLFKLFADAYSSEHIALLRLCAGAALSGALLARALLPASSSQKPYCAYHIQSENYIFAYTLQFKQISISAVFLNSLFFKFEINNDNAARRARASHDLRAESSLNRPEISTCRQFSDFTNAESLTDSISVADSCSSCKSERIQRISNSERRFGKSGWNDCQTSRAFTATAAEPTSSTTR